MKQISGPITLIMQAFSIFFKKENLFYFIKINLFILPFSVMAENIINCDLPGLSDLYKKNVCEPLKQHADNLLNSRAEAAEPVLIYEKLDIQAYRVQGIRAITNIQGQGTVNTGTNAVDEKNNEPFHF